MKHIGEKFGCYTIIAKTDQRANDYHWIYEAHCECGKVRYATYGNIKLSIDTPECPHYLHFGDITIPSGLIKNKKIAHIFYGMLRRCYDKEDDDFANYGNKGIKVCSEWISNPSSFEKWSLENGYKPKLTIDRILESKDYSPNNCRWVTREINARFKSNTNYITATVTLSGRQWGLLIPDVGENFINKMLKKDGMEETVSFIETTFKDKRDLTSS